MARRFLDDIRTDLATLVGSGKNLQGADDLQLRLDTIDSTIADECVIAGVTEQSTALTNTFTPIVNAFTDEKGADGLFLFTDTTLGTCTSSATAGFTYKVAAQIGFEADNNEDYEFTILEDGVPVGFVDILTGTGNNDFQTANVEYLSLSTPASAVWQVGARVLDGSTNLTITDIVLALEVRPTNNAT